MLQATIQNFSYQKMWREELDNLTFENINILPSECLISFKNKILALSKWVSPKRTRSLPLCKSI